MAKRKRRNKKTSSKQIVKKGNKKESFFHLSEKLRRTIFSVLFFLLSIIIFFSFFNSSGAAGAWLKKIFFNLVGATIFFLPLIFILMGLIYAKTRYKKFIIPVLSAFFLIIIGISGFFEISNFGINLEEDAKSGGWIGRFFGKFLLNLFDFWISAIIFFCVILLGALILNQLMRGPFSEREASEERKKSFIPSIFKKVIGGKSSFEVKEIKEEEGIIQEEVTNDYRKKLIKEKEELKEKKEEKEQKEAEESLYQLPPLFLLENDKGTPNSGDIKINSNIIKRTFENFDILVDMSEINVGPTVTQYAFKPAEGIKLSRITSLSNDLSLALAAHPIRIEAPIPGRSLVGIEVPNKERAGVRLRNLVEQSEFQESPHRLLLVFGRDVSGIPVFANLAKMPHMLVAGATGTGKTIFLNNLIISLLYRNTPETLRLIMVDPKRVEFSNFANIPHLLAPIIYDVDKTCNALKWLVGEMERRLQVLADNKSRDIGSYNEKVEKENSKKKEGEEKRELMPYIVLIVDELADLMAAKGREIEAGIVRLAQIARAAGIHLILATQRPSVEVITGLVKANVTTRVTFQVASQVDSRTVLDTSGAERLLGAGDMLYISGDISKPKRVQAPYISEKELRDVVKWVKDQRIKEEDDLDELSENLERKLEEELPDGTEPFDFSDDAEEDLLYDDAKNIVIEIGRASASLLQRRLRIGYVRAARLLDALEERGVVGPADGAKPREVYFKKETDEDGNEWEKI